MIADLIARGRSALDEILPQECAQLSADQNRRYDAALVFLLFPLCVVRDPAMVDLLLHDVDRFLTGEWGIRRYLGDSYWAPDYEARVRIEDRTRDFSTGADMRNRDRCSSASATRPSGACSIRCCRPSMAHDMPSAGQRRISTGRRCHFNRALSQVTASWRCPELYYLRQGQYVENPHTPLQWTQANLMVAIQAMRTSIGGPP